MTVFYLDPISGNDAADGSTFALGGLPAVGPWKTMKSGATAVRIAPGDTIRIAKSPDPVSIGDATWTSKSKTVTLASAQTKTIDLAETAWTGANSYVVARTAGGKEGSYYMKIAAPDPGTASKLAAYFDLPGATDFSAYQKISLWFQNSAILADAETWYIALCDDVGGGGTAQDIFKIPAIAFANAAFYPLTLTKDGGGNLFNAVKSIALFTGTTAPVNSSYVILDDIIACTTNGLNLQSLISKNSAASGGVEAWYGIQSIDGVTVMLDNIFSTTPATARGYYTTGTSPETVTTYMRETSKVGPVPTNDDSNKFTEDGVAGSLIYYEGGYNTATDIRDGETFLDGVNGRGYGIYLDKSYISIKYVSVCRFNSGYYSTDGTLNNYDEIECTSACNCTNGANFQFTTSNIIIRHLNNNSLGFYLVAGYSSSFTITNTNNNGSYGTYILTARSCTVNMTGSNNNGNYGLYLDELTASELAISSVQDNLSYGFNFYLCRKSKLYLGTVANNTTIGVSFDSSGPSYDIKIFNLVSSGHTYGVQFWQAWDVYLINPTLSDPTPVYNRAGVITKHSDMKMFVQKYGGDINDNRIYTGDPQVANNPSMFSQTATRHVASGLAWEFQPGSVRNSFEPLKLSIAKIACAANKQVTVKAWMKKDHATNIACKIICRGSQVAGVASDVEAVKADDTDWEELTLNFTPTEQGVVEIEGWAWYVAGDSNAYVHDMAISQA